jgi:GH43 family beta-xylosidase
MSTHYLAQINIARMVAPIDHPVMAEFVRQLDPINALADASPGFIWRLQSATGNATDISYNDDPMIIVNMSVWDSLEALQQFVYKSHHVGVFRDRAKWFEKSSAPTYALWWVPKGHIPTVNEGRARLEHYRKHGATPYSFWFQKFFPEPEEVLA